MKRFSLILLAILTASGVVAGLLPTQRAQALSGADFKPGKIIDDAVFFNKDSMTVQQIQDFLNAKVPVCDTYHAGFTGASGTVYSPPFTCLKEYQENPTTHENNISRPTYQVPGGQTAAQIIWNASQAYGINPQVIITTLQKESGIVTDTWAASWQYKTAMGYGCPDTAACDANYYGFYNQVTSAAWQWRRYTTYPDQYNFKGGVTRYIQYNPSASCGGTSVYLENQATANLYNYTPYQPNPAALSVMNDSTAGGSVTCGAYGNRNFFWYFTKWFGSTTYGNLIKTAGGGVYFIENGLKRVFPSELVFLSYDYKWSNVSTITSSMLTLIPDGTPMTYNTRFREGRLVSAPNQGVFLVDTGLKRPIVSETAFLSYNYKWSDVLPISSAELALIPDGTPITYNVRFREGRLVTAPNLGVYLIDTGKKRPIVSDTAFTSYGYKWSDVLPISSAELALIPDGTPITYNVHFRDGKLLKTATGGVYLVENGLKRAFPSESIFLSYGYKWSDIVTISSVELSLIPNGANMTTK